MNKSLVKVSVLIATRNRSAVLAEALESVREQDYPDFEIVIVDNSSGEEKIKTEVIAKTFGACYIFDPRPGVSLARNVGSAAASGDIIAVIDDDCLPCKTWMSSIVKNYSDPQVWGCTGRVISHQKDAESKFFDEVAGQDLGTVGRVFTKKDVQLRTSILLAHVGSIFSKHLKSKGPAPWCIGHGSSMSFRKSGLMELGGLDTRFGSGGSLKTGEDMDIHYRILKSGHSIIYDPAATVVHKHDRVTLEKVYQIRYTYSFGAAALMYEYRRDPLMFCMLIGRRLQLLIKLLQYKLTGKKELVRTFSEDIRGVRDGIAAQQKNPRDPKLKP